VQRVVAVVTTYNRKDLLLECVRAVLAQTHPVERLFIVDGASTDGTDDLLRESGVLDDPRVAYERLPTNEGSSGGFAAAIDLARQTDADWIWLMDDDAEPVPDALEQLVGSAPAADASVVAVCSKVIHPDGTLDANQRGHFRRRLRPLAPEEYRPGHHPALDFLSFVGTILRTETARRVGLPKREFFVWGDDVEYSFRVRREGEIRLVSESVMLHKRVAHSYENARSRFWNRVLPVTMWPTPAERFWQNLCGLRNYIWMKREYEGQGALSAVGTTAQFMVKHLLYDDRPLRRMRWIVRYARDGRAGRFANIPPARWVEMVRAGEL
jgi:GT2 family glycosyltransferase